MFPPMRNPTDHIMASRAGIGKGAAKHAVHADCVRVHYLYRSIDIVD
jgi:hypothetical protein